MAITLLELRTQARQRADMERSQFITDSELNIYINSSIAELYDLLITAYDSEYNISTYTFTTVTGTTSYDLPTDLYKLRGVDAAIGGPEFKSVRKFTFNERNRDQFFSGWDYNGYPTVRYRLVGSQILFAPAPDSETDIRLWYIPLAAKLVADTDELNDLNQFAEYVIVDAAIKMLQKEESDVSVLFAQKEALRNRIEDMAKGRDAGTPDEITDIYTANYDFFE